MHAVIFDIDGTLLHSAAVDDALYRQAVLDVLGDVALRESLHDYEYVTDTGILWSILDDNDLAREQHVDAVRSRFVELLELHIRDKGPFREIPGAGELLRSLCASPRHAVAMATGGWRQSAEFESVSYYGDGPWDRAACAALGWEFVAVGEDLEGLLSYVGHAPISGVARAG